MTKYEAFCLSKSIKFGNDFDTSDLSTKFIPYFNSGERIRVSIDNETHDGYVGVTTGRKPSFLLVFNSRSRGSSILLNDDYRIVKIFSTRRS